MKISPNAPLTMAGVNKFAKTRKEATCAPVSQDSSSPRTVTAAMTSTNASSTMEVVLNCAKTAKDPEDVNVSLVTSWLMMKNRVLPPRKVWIF